MVAMALWCLWIPAGVSAAPGPTPAREARERFFGLTNLWEIRLTFSRSTWAAMEPVESGPPGQDRSYPWGTATFACAGEVLTNVAVRFKGNSSFNNARRSLKKPFKIDFDRGSKGREFRGHEELWLNNNINDATQFREALGYELFRRAGIPAPRTAFARVFLTWTSSADGPAASEYLGLYTVVEAIEGDFLARHFASKDGLLLKPERVPALAYLGEDWNAYPSRYQPRSKFEAADTVRFLQLARLVSEGSDDALVRELPARLEVAAFLRFVALNALLANYDSILGTGHNYFLFQPRPAGPVRFLPWDLNESFGGHPGAGPRRRQAEFGILQPCASPNRLVDRLLAQPDWAATYRREVEALLGTVCEPERVLPDASRLAELLRESVAAESAVARGAFERVALGFTNTSGATESGSGSPTATSHEPRPEARPDQALLEASVERGPRRFRGLPPGLIEDQSFAEWFRLRIQNIREELAGTRRGLRPEMRMGPGGPGAMPGPMNRPQRPDRIPRPPSPLRPD